MEIILGKENTKRIFILHQCTLKRNPKKKEKNLIVKFYSYKEAIVYMLLLVMKKWG